MSEDVRKVVLELIRRGETFTAADVARALDQPIASVPVARAVRRLADEGALAALGYQRRLQQERTAQGVITRVSYGPRGRPRRTRIAVASTAPTRTPAARPLGAQARTGRRVRALITSLESRVTEGGHAIIRAGEHLLSIERLVGPRAARKHAEETLGLSATTYRRWTSIARAFAGQRAVLTLAAARPSALAALAAPSCPPQLREEVLTRGGLVVGGRRIPLNALRRADVEAAIHERQG